MRRPVEINWSCWGFNNHVQNIPHTVELSSLLGIMGKLDWRNNNQKTLTAKRRTSFANVMTEPDTQRSQEGYHFGRLRLAVMMLI